MFEAVVGTVAKLVGSRDFLDYYDVFNAYAEFAVFVEPGLYTWLTQIRDKTQSVRLRIKGREKKRDTGR